MFRAKVEYYKNLNGKTEKLVREFDNKKDYDKFLEKHPEVQSQIDFNGIGWPSMWLESFHQYIDGLFEHKLNNKFDPDFLMFDEFENTAVPLDEDDVNINEYEQAIEKIESEEKNKEQELTHLKENLKKLNSYKEEFKKHHRTSLLKRVEKDIHKIEDKIHKMEK